MSRQKKTKNTTTNPKLSHPRGYLMLPPARGVDVDVPERAREAHDGARRAGAGPERVGRRPGADRADEVRAVARVDAHGRQRRGPQRRALLLGVDDKLNARDVAVHVDQEARAAGARHLLAAQARGLHRRPLRQHVGDAERGAGAVDAGRERGGVAVRRGIPLERGDDGADRRVGELLPLAVAEDGRLYGGFDAAQQVVHARSACAGKQSSEARAVVRAGDGGWSAGHG